MGEIRKTTLLEKFNIPVNNLDFKYIEKCTNVRELGQILTVLRSGEEGFYPDLMKCCEKRLEYLDPKNKFLRKEYKPIMSSDLSPKQREEIVEDLGNSLQKWKELDSELKTRQLNPSMDIPDIRQSNTPELSRYSEKPRKLTKPRISSYDYSGWDKYDLEGELEKLNVEEEKKVPIHIPKVDFSVDVGEYSVHEKQRIAELERIKGNEAYEAGDYTEAETYYNRSISICCSATALNNRAQAYIKMKKYNSAIEDCNQVLLMEPDNVKALLRRGTAYKSNFNFEQAMDDFERVLQINPESNAAQRSLKEIREALPNTKRKQQRVLIEEI